VIKYLTTGVEGSTSWLAVSMRVPAASEVRAFFTVNSGTLQVRPWTHAKPVRLCAFGGQKGVNLSLMTRGGHSVLVFRFFLYFG
jgi:hypothetical protein